MVVVVVVVAVVVVLLVVVVVVICVVVVSVVVGVNLCEISFSNFSPAVPPCPSLCPSQHKWLKLCFSQLIKLQNFGTFVGC